MKADNVSSARWILPRGQQRLTLMTSQKQLCIRGKVQGVGYRYSLRSQAQSLGVTGWCRNLPTGEVEALIQGPLTVLEQLIEWCYAGPSHASVEHIQVADANHLPVLTEFEIRR